MTAAIEIDRLSFKYRGAEQPALQEISLKIEQGQYVAILGACGAGKTTLCLTMNGIIPNMLVGEMYGTVQVQGSFTHQTPVREMAKRIGMVFDNPEFQLSQMSVREEIALGLENLGLPRNEMERRITEALAIVEMQGFQNRSPMALSGGQQQRIAVAAALAMYPQILVLDEPTTNLDPVGKEEVFRITRKLNKERGMTVVIAEHEVEVVAEYADQVIVLHEGRVIASGPPADVFNQVDLLAQCGLRVPQVTEAIHLATDGHWTGSYPVTLPDAVAALHPRLEGRQ